MQHRIKRLREGIDATANFVSFNLTNIRYLTGFTGSNGALIITPSDAHLITDSRYEIQAGAETDGIQIHIANDLNAKFRELVQTDLVYYEPNHITVNMFTRLQEVLTGASFVDAKRVVERLRIIKERGEIELIAKASSIATQALTSVIEQIHPGLTERDVAVMLDRTMVDYGADDIAFETIVASGPNSAIPHHTPTAKELHIGDLLKIDFGAKLQGYHSDCTRTFVIGKPTSWQKDIYLAVQAAQSAGRESLESGISANLVTESVKASLELEEFAQYFTHGLGHGVGLQIHEDPFLSSSEAVTLKDGTVVTIEPGVYLPEQGGVRIEDTVVVTQDGYQNLTVFDYDLIHIG